MSKQTICQECGQQLSSWTDKHSLEDCGKYHLKRAEEILKFNLNDIKASLFFLNSQTKEYREEISDMSDDNKDLDEMYFETKEKLRITENSYKKVYLELEQLKVTASNGQKETEKAQP